MATNGAPSGEKLRVVSAELAEAIRALFPRYPNRRAVTLPALHLVHESLRQVPLEAVVDVAQILGLAPAEVQDTLTFYGFFKQHEPHGRTRAWVCRSIACALRGGEEILEHMAHVVGVKPGQTTADGKLTLEFAECLGACDFAPCMLANKTLHKNLTPESATEFIQSLS